MDCVGWDFTYFTATLSFVQAVDTRYSCIYYNGMVIFADKRAKHFQIDLQSRKYSKTYFNNISIT